jgi:hypothetical protein
LLVVHNYLASGRKVAKPEIQDGISSNKLSQAMLTVIFPVVWHKIQSHSLDFVHQTRFLYKSQIISEMDSTVIFRQTEHEEIPPSFYLVT